MNLSAANIDSGIWRTGSHMTPAAKVDSTLIGETWMSLESSWTLGVQGTGPFTQFISHRLPGDQDNILPHVLWEYWTGRSMDNYTEKE